MFETYFRAKRYAEKIKTITYNLELDAWATPPWPVIKQHDMTGS